MPDEPPLRTPAEVKELFAYHGVSVAQWARENGFSAQMVHKVINGQSAMSLGQSHKIAVLLGMKKGNTKGLDGLGF